MVYADFLVMVPLLYLVGQFKVGYCEDDGRKLVQHCCIRFGGTIFDTAPLKNKQFLLKTQLLMLSGKIVTYFLVSNRIISSKTCKCGDNGYP